MLTILCIATYFKGDAYLRECRRLGCTVLLLTSDSLAGAAWPRDAIDEIHSIPRDAVRRRHPAPRRRDRAASTAIERIAALDDFDVETAAMLREHLQVPGIGRTVASGFRDKLAMRIRARALGIPVPEFSPVFNDQALDDFTGRVAGAVGAQAAIVRGGDRHQEGREPRRALARARSGGRPAVRRRPRTVRAGRRVSRRLDRLGRRGRVRRCVQVRPAADGDRAPGWPVHHAPAAGRFDEGRCAARAEPPAAGRAGAAARRLAHRVHPRCRQTAPTCFSKRPRASAAPSSSTPSRRRPGINLWREWAKIDIAGERGDYAVPPHRRDYAGIVLSLARQEEPDMSALHRRGDRHDDPQAPPRGRDRQLARSAADRRADWRLHAALLPRLLRDRAAAGAPGRVIKRTLRNVWSPELTQPPRRRRLSAARPTAPARDRYPVVYMHDGQNLSDPGTAFAGTWELDVTLERLAGRGIEAIVVGVHNAGRRAAGGVQPVSGSAPRRRRRRRYLAFLVDSR